MLNRSRRAWWVAGVLAGALWLIACGYTGSSADAARPGKTVTVTLGAYNVENYFDRYNDPYTDDQGTAPKEAHEVKRLAQAIRAMRADFVGVVEMENEGELYRFANEHLPDLGYKNVYVGHRDYGRGINNGGMTRLPVGGVTTHRFWPLTVPGDERQWRFARDVIEFELRPAEGVTLHVFVLHFKSKRDSRRDPKSASWRLAEARGVRRLVEQRLAADPGALIALVGDFNDERGSAPLKHLLDERPRVLVDCHRNVPAARKITYLREPYRSQIDYILVSPALARCLKAGSAKVPTTALEGSDHAPVVATFELPVGRE